MEEKVVDVPLKSYLPSRPVYMSIIKTLEGKAIDFPIWNSFTDNPNERKLDNETLSSTLISLSKTLSQISEIETKGGKVMIVKVEEKTYNFFVPYKEDEFQISFIVAFEERDNILIKDEHKIELTKKVVKALKGLKPFNAFIGEETKKHIHPGTTLYEEIDKEITKIVKKWDKKRVKYVKTK